MRLLMQFLAVAALAGSWHLSVPAAHAQNAPSSPDLPAPAANIPDQKIKAVAAAVERVASLREDYEQRMATTSVPAEQERISAEASDALTKAVTDQGLSVEEYASILVTAQNDSEVRGKILQRIRPSTR